MRHRKTRRRLKRRRLTRRQQKRLQRGGAVESAINWVKTIAEVFEKLPDWKAVRLSDLSSRALIANGLITSDNLTLVPPTDEERAEAVGGELVMEFTVIEGDVQRSEDIRDVALSVRGVLQKIIEPNTSLESMTSQEFIDAINNSNLERLADDTGQDSLKYLLTRENALRRLADRDELTTETKQYPGQSDLYKDTLIAAATDGPLFIWALAANISGDVETVSLFTPRALSAPTESTT
jgi:hypothetical protein